MDVRPASDASESSPGTVARDAQAPIRSFHLVDSFNIGGTESQMVQLVTRLRRAGWPVAVGCLQARGPLLEVVMAGGISVTEFPMGGSFFRVSALRQMVRLARLLRAGRYDVLHAHDLYANLLGIVAARLAGVPVVIASRRDLGSPWWESWARKVVLRSIQKLATVVLANSRAVAEYLVEVWDVPATRVTVIHNAVDLGKFAAAGACAPPFPPASEGDFLVASVGNMHSAVKGYEYLIDAARQVCAEMPNAKFLLIGDGALRERFERQAREAGITEKVIFLGRRSDVPQILSRCELLVSASLSEGMPNAVLEAMAAGLPVVATAVGGTSEVVDQEQTGLLVPPRDAGALAAAVLRLAKDPDRRREMGAAARRRAQTDFSFDRLVAEVKALYTAQLAAHARPQPRTG